MTDAISNLSIWQMLEWFGMLISFVYLWLELEQKKLMWVLSAICSIVYICIYAHNGFYADMGMSFVNICMCAYGYTKWRRRLVDGRLRGRDEKERIEYTHFTLRTFFRTALESAALWCILFVMLVHAPGYLSELLGVTIRPSAAPLGDAFTTMVNLVSIWVMARRIIEVWVMYFLANGVAVYLYLIKGMYPTAFLYSVYFVASIVGYVRWWRGGTRVA